MGIALLSAARLMDAVPSWIHALWPSASPCPQHARVGRTSTGLPHKPAVAPAAALRINRPLRVLRVVDTQQANTGAGRMVISGRMADVCAELDRLAEAEASLSRH